MLRKQYRSVVKMALGWNPQGKRKRVCPLKHDGYNFATCLAILSLPSKCKLQENLPHVTVP